MMRQDPKRLREMAVDVTPTLTEPSDRQSQKLDAARAVSRRAQALLAAAGESEPSVARWYVLVIEAGADNAVDNDLQNAGIEHWMAAAKRTSKWRGGRRFQRFCAVMTPLFPGYMFVRLHWTHVTWAGLATVPGVVGVIGGALSPAPLNENEFNKFRLRAENDPKFIEDLTNALKAGDVVRVDDGPFALFEGIVRSLGKGGRLNVDVGIFGRTVSVKLALAQVTKRD